MDEQWHVLLRDMASGQERPLTRLPAIVSQFQFRRGVDTQLNLAFAPDQRTLGVAWGHEPSRKYELRLLEAASGGLIATLPARGETFAFAPDGRHVAVGMGSEGILVWDLSHPGKDAAPGELTELRAQGPLGGPPGGEMRHVPTGRVGRWPVTRAARSPSWRHV